jgi:uncharacterized protein (TIGR02145 family)
MKKTITMLLLFCTVCFAQNTFTDSRDGKKYKSVKIGEQTWMSQNLDYGGEDGDIGVCSDNDPKNCQKYGRLYNWEDAMVACPDGWHLPSDEEWQSLANFAGGIEIAGRKLKSRSGWEKWDCEWTAVDDRGRTTKLSKCNLDSYGFSALPSSSKGTYSDWWTATESHWGAVDTYMLYNSTEMMFQGKEWKMYQSNNNYSKTKTLSVRCLKGEGKLPDKIAAKKTALATAEATKKAEKIAEASNPLTTEVTDEGTILRGSTLAKKLAWLQRSAESHNTYIVEVNANENIAPHTFYYQGAINITIILRGDAENRTLRLQSHGTMFTVGSNVTLTLDGNITIKGHSGNDNAMIFIDGGILTMNAGTTVTGNSGGGVTVGEHYRNSGTFTMNGGTISGNSSYGVGLGRGTFTMNEGSISDNNNGGVHVGADCSFTMRGGTINGNTSSNGGGVWVDGTFTMRGGTITGNTARENGGGVYVRNYRTFTKTGGTITGYNSDRSEGNAVKDEDGVIARRGHAVSYDKSNKRKETTAEPDDDLSCSNRGCTGTWDD